MKQRKRITIKDIAQHLKISPMTVSRALSDNPKARVRLTTKQRVLKTASKLGYYPDLLARAVAMRKSGFWGMLTFGISDPIQASYVEGMMIEAERRGYQLIMGLINTSYSQNLRDNLPLQIRQMISRGVDGLIIHMPGEADESKVIPEAVKDMVPIIAFNRAVEGISSVAVDRAAGICEATEHLIRLGYRRIGFVRGRGNSVTAEAKWQGYLRAVEAHGLTPERTVPRSSTLETGYRTGIRLGRMSDRPEAFICMGDLPAIGICRGLQEAGVRVPEEVGVVGFDGLEIGAYCVPPLTSVAHPVEEICREAAKLLIDQLNGGGEVRQVMVRPRLVVRQSCGANAMRFSRTKSERGHI